MQTKAAVARVPGGDFTIETLDIHGPGPGEVLVRIAGVGLCHTDLIFRDQFAPYPLPAVLGHEGAGTIEELGEGVSGLAVGSAVITAKAGIKTISITVSVVTKVYSTGTVVNCARRVNVRASASGAGALVGYAYLGDTYKVLDRSSNWFKIQYNATTTAYIWSRYLNATETTAGYVSSGAVGTATPAPGTTPAQSNPSLRLG